VSTLYDHAVRLGVIPCRCPTCSNREPFAAFTARREADSSEPVAGEPGVPLAEPHRHDLDVMGHA
jgi:hypothetical protein